MITDETIITIDDIRRAGFCVDGFRDLAKRNNHDLRHFLRNGAPVGLLRTWGEDALLDRVLSVKREI